MSRRFGRYLIRDELTEELGRGAFGRVYRAFDPNINRYVAIKVLSSGSDPEMFVRFQDESKTAGKLEHENIVKVYDFDLQEGLPYLVMELLDGETLETIIKTQKVAGLPIQLLDKVEIMLQVGKGLQYAHAENVVHRDIKPGNIMVLPNGTVKVMDFGIARVMDKDGTRRTRQGDIAGTVLYMAPEQFSGRDADKRSDIFAYADVFYELLTGEHPFYGTDFATVMYRITTVEPGPIRDKVPECPAALDSMIQRLLVKDPEIRPDRLDEVLLKTQLILQRLRRERAVIIAAEIEPLIRSGASDKAETVIAQVLRLDPLNQEAEHWQGQIQQERDRKTRHARAEALVRQGREQLNARRFKEASQSVENALKLDPDNEDIRGIVDQVRLTLKNVQDAARLLVEARAGVEQGRLEQALDNATRATDLDPGNTEAPQLRDQLRNEIRIRQEAAMLSRADALCSSGDYDAALEVLDEADAAGLTSPKIAASRVRVGNERSAAEKRRRQAAFAAALSKGREALYGQRLPEAGDTAEALCAEYPEEPAAFEFRSEVQEHLRAHKRAEDINRATQTARALIKERRLDDAREVLKNELLTYPRDTGMYRLMEMVDSLAAAQERARKISQVVRQSRNLAEEGRLDEALQAVLEAIGAFGQETSLLECKRNYELERDQRAYARGLQSVLEQGRRLMAESNPAGAIELLDDAMVQYPGEPDIGLLLSSARSSLAAFREAEFVRQHRDQLVSLEAAEQYGQGLALIEAALTRYAGNAELLASAQRLRQKLHEQDRKRLLDGHIRRIEAGIEAGDWESAARRCETAQQDFPQEALLTTYADKIRDAHRQQAMAALQLEVRASLARQDLEAASRQLETARPEYSEDVLWKALWQELERCRSYAADLKEAAEACAAGAYDQAEELLQRWLSEAPDPRAASLSETLSQRRQEAAEQARREAAKRQEEGAVGKRRKEAEAAVQQGDYQGAVTILDELAGRYPNRPEIQQDREIAVQALEQQRRRQENAAIGKALSEASVFARQGDYPRALAMLDELDRRYPDRPEIRMDREAVRQGVERQRREAEELARRQEADAAIAKGRRDAEEALQRGDYGGAVTILDGLDRQYPGRPEVQADREVVLEAQQRVPRQKMEDAAVAKALKEAEAAVQQGDHAHATSILDELAHRYPQRSDIQKAAAQVIEQQRRRVAEAREQQQRAAEAEVRRQQEEALIAQGRSDAGALLRKGDHQSALALLEGLAKRHPDNLEIARDREAALLEWERAQAANAVADARRRAAQLVEQREYEAAVAMLQDLAVKHPDEPGVRADLDAAELAWRQQRQQAEEQARIRQVAADIAEGRRESATLIAGGAYADAIARLDDLAKEYGSYAGIERDREAAAAALDRQRQRAAVSEARREAATRVSRGDYQGALAVLDELVRHYPDAPDVKQDREAIQRGLERQAREAAERERQQREQQVISEARADAAAMIQNGDYEAATVILDQIAGGFPDDTGIRQDRAALTKLMRTVREEADEKARQEQEQLRVTQVRQEAAGLTQKGEHQQALAMLDRLAGEYPGDPAIRAERDGVASALEQQRQETESRAQRALSAYSSGRQRDATDPALSPSGPSADAADQAALSREEAAEQRAKTALAALSAKRSSAGLSDTSAPIKSTPRPFGRLASKLREKLHTDRPDQS